ncbi:SusD/RagB family nutrient-binding outer membrane lipoprotein [Hymenobacter properus]|uniref:SusD/RagB family nutrient-binding outer membrane lipoprotein n=1 Tax=Hymenobacter properus TaxID=2791026 RepID=A0A931BEV1_9BACT|nr:SusD/RagB family nutrient-binding outer membrane lipoprotein [Hymenobacter properus]MBF9142129.1 SusD/RagB family nutrient-binding outer membrane lipoprotein [Hymenobacter properus]MBR7720936.1 SusD/RagB family nutrient-binding outer membrane lipoprotein [Microvirga sp. SRT04]
MTATTGCEKFLDINQNPNAFTAESVTPDVVLAQALTNTAAIYSGNTPSYNSYSSWAVGYWSKTNTVSGYGEEQTYNYGTSYYAGLFDNTYDNLNDYNIIQTRGAANYPRHAAIARIMKAYGFLLLVDQYGDIPYTQALQGASNVTPVYDKAQDIYKDLLVQLTGAIADINAAPAGARSVGVEDVVFAGNMTKWKQFANSLKLRILLRESQTGNSAIDSDVRAQLQALQTAPDGFITSDVVVQPGYAQNTGQQNPFFTRYGYTAAGTSATERNYQVPTQFILDQYTTNNDPRVSQLYTMGARVIAGVNTPGYVGAVLGEANPPTTGTATASTRQASRFRGAETTSPGAATAGGIFKGVSAPTPLMLLSEHLFNKAEVETRNLFTGDAKQDFLNGIKASFIYFYRAGTTSLAAINSSTLATTTSATPGVTQYDTYIAANTANPLVNYDIATTNGALGKQAAIIFQKYLALNSVASTEAWDDFRRTGLPRIPLPVTAAQGKFPTRLLYPLSEASTNSGNVPAGVTQYTKIFWDVVD